MTPMEPQHSAAPAPDWERYRTEFPIFRSSIYFNSCSLGALSVRVEAAVARFLALWHEHGAAAWYGPWWETMEALRARCARVIGASPDEIALFPSITAALTAVASAFAYRDRPRVIMSRLDFPTTVYQWLAKQASGVQPVLLGRPEGLAVPPDEYAAAVDRRTELVVASHVYFTSGYLQDVAAIAEIAHARDALCLIDAYQATGQVPTDVHALGIDFLVTGSLKWLLGGPGFAFLYVKRDLHDRLHPNDVGWFAHREQFAFRTDVFEPAPDARGFQGGTPSVAALYAADAGLDIVLEIGGDRLRARQLDLVGDLVARLRQVGLPSRVPPDLTRHAGIVTVPVPDPPATVAALRRQGIIVDSRPGVVRLSPFFYNIVEDNRAVAAAVREVVITAATTS
ncbi:MAG: aminotransferase class V-fold PLP-dependent enzyme [Armatimonadetes bacterium]|nr:aminotransferase class V-fold PLP-dependent enzyme [Armatimonadota bacterium]